MLTKPSGSARLLNKRKPAPEADFTGFRPRPDNQDGRYQIIFEPPKARPPPY
jgi:hypothetical protein